MATEILYATEEEIQAYKSACKRYKALWIVQWKTFFIVHCLLTGLIVLYLYSLVPDEKWWYFASFPIFMEILALVALGALIVTFIFFYGIIRPLVRWKMGILLAPKVPPVAYPKLPEKASKREIRDWFVEQIEKYENHEYDTGYFIHILEESGLWGASDSLADGLTHVLWEHFADEPDVIQFTKLDLSMLTGVKLALKTNRDVECKLLYPIPSSVRRQILVQALLLFMALAATISTFYFHGLPIWIFALIWGITGVISAWYYEHTPYQWRDEDLVSIRHAEHYALFQNYKDIAQIMRRYGIRRKKPEKAMKAQQNGEWRWLVSSAIYGGLRILQLLIGTYTERSEKIVKLQRK